MLNFEQEQNSFLKKITELVHENLSNEHFGVSELADKIGMSRSNLLRKVQKQSNLSVSQFIREIRLQKSLELLEENSLNITEIAYKVGFNSPSYYIKCFREYYGYPPGEANSKLGDVSTVIKPNRTSSFVRKSIYIAVPLIIVTLVLIVRSTLLKSNSSEQQNKSIAVLPFKNDSNDSTNLYLINGLMESILNKLQKVEDIRVISRTSVEKYRHSNKSIKEIAKELNVRYFVVGSGQKSGNKILLNIQLIDGKSDKHLWAEQFNKELNDIFSLQQEVALSITTGIEAIITPEEEARIEKVPTNNLVAYDYFLQGREYLNQGDKDGLIASIPLLEKAIQNDPQFARAYAALAIAYYYLDIFQIEKKHIKELNFYADQAILLDPDLSQSLIAKAFYYIAISEAELAVPYLEKALEHSPNSAMAINILSDIYTSHLPNTGKYLEYALLGMQVDISSIDSTSTSYVYLHLSNALIQTGFVDEALKYIDRSLEYNPSNIYSEYVRAYILYAKNKDLNQTKNSILKAYSRDTTRLDVIQELGNVYYYLKDYDSAHYYFTRLETVKSTLGLNLYSHKYAEIGVTADKLGYDSLAAIYLSKYEKFIEEDESIYKDLGLAMLNSFNNQTDEALKHLKNFTQCENFHYWILIFVDMNPMMDNIRDDERYSKYMKQLEENFMKAHDGIEKSLKRKKLLD